MTEHRCRRCNAPVNDGDSCKCWRGYELSEQRSDKELSDLLLSWMQNNRGAPFDLLVLEAARRLAG